LQAALNTASEQEEFLVTPGQKGLFPDLSQPRALFLHMGGDGIQLGGQ